MTQTFTYSSDSPSWSENLGTEAVRLGSEDGFSEEAYMGGVGTAGIAIDNPDGTVGHSADQIKGLKNFIVTESAAPANNQRIATCYFAARKYRRGGSDRGSLRTTLANVIDGTILDDNAIFQFRLMTGTSAGTGNRPAETVDDRIAWLLGSGYLDLADNGLVASSSVNLTANNYGGQFAGDVMADCAVAAHFNYFAYYDESADQRSLAFFNPNSSTLYTSDLQLTNVLADVDSFLNTGVGATQTWASEAELDLDPARVVAGAYGPYNGGAEYRTRAATATDFAWRDRTAPNANVHSAAAMDDILDEFLEENATEEPIVHVTFQVPAANVNDLRKGQRMQGWWSHLPGYTTPTWFRVMRRSVAQDQLTPDVYTIRADLSPQERTEYAAFRSVHIPAPATLPGSYYVDPFGTPPATFADSTTAGYAQVIAYDHHPLANPATVWRADLGYDVSPYLFDPYECTITFTLEKVYPIVTTGLTQQEIFCQPGYTYDSGFTRAVQFALLEQSGSPGPFHTQQVEIDINTPGSLHPATVTQPVTIIISRKAGAAYVSAGGFTRSVFFTIPSITATSTFSITWIANNQSGSSTDNSFLQRLSNVVITPTPGTGISRTYQFVDESGDQQDITDWAWDFGDAGTSTLQNPTHTYATSGNKTVQLTVTYANTDTRTYSTTVSVP